MKWDDDARREFERIVFRHGFAHVAEELGVHRATVYRWASGERRPSWPHCTESVESLFRRHRGSGD